MSCTYRKIGSDGYGTDWVSSCNKRVRMISPIDVGFSFDPLPNEDGKFCPYCGEEIIIKE